MTTHPLPESAVELAARAAYSAMDMGSFPSDAIYPEADRDFVRAAILAALPAIREAVVGELGAENARLREALSNAHKALIGTTRACTPQQMNEAHTRLWAALKDYGATAEGGIIDATIDLMRLVDKHGISVSKKDGSLAPSLEQLVAFAKDYAAAPLGLEAAVREYLAARSAYEYAKRKPNSHAPEPQLPLGSPITARWVAARHGLDAALTEQESRNG